MHLHSLWMKIRVISGISLFLMVTDGKHPALPFLGLYLVLDRSFSLFQMVCLKYIHHCSKKASSCTIWSNDALLPPKAPHSSPGPSLCNTPSLPGNSCPEGTAPAPQMQKDWLLTPVPRLHGNHQQSPPASYCCELTQPQSHCPPPGAEAVLSIPQGSQRTGILQKGRGKEVNLENALEEEKKRKWQIIVDSLP